MVEGVHLSLGLVKELMAAHHSIVPFLVHISNEAKHLERFAVRAKAMSLRADGDTGGLVAGRENFMHWTRLISTLLPPASLATARTEVPQSGGWHGGIAEN